MGCCGKARANLSVSRAAATAAPAPANGSTNQPASPRPASTGTLPLRLRYVGQQGIVVRGPATGRPYTFTGAEPVHTVDPRDAAVLLRTQYFRSV
jgi:hypothetical protein